MLSLSALPKRAKIHCRTRSGEVIHDNSLAPIYNPPMFDWLTRRRRMKGGLYFGPPAWSPDAIEGMASAQASSAPSPTPQEIPTDRAAFVALLQSLGFGRTSAITPGLLEQSEDLGERRVRALVLNLLPTQPEDAIASALTRLSLNEMVQGLAAIRKVSRARKVLIVVDRHDWRTRRLWRRALKRHKGGRCQMVKLLNRYPQGHPILLLRSLFGKRVAVGKLPTRANRFIVSPVACWALGRFILTGERYTQRPVQLFAPMCKEHPAPRLVMANIGESVADFCARVGVHSSPTAELQIIVNGMMAGQEVDPATARIQTDTESIAIRPRPALEQSTPCFSCGWCLDVCPTGLNPVNLLDLAERASNPTAPANELPAADVRESLHCIGCGLCSYVCPTRLPLTEAALQLRGRVASALEPRPSPV
jgi:Na+-translocating ferredoxin:NAD+ oxidoreductase subunit C